MVNRRFPEHFDAVNRRNMGSPETDPLQGWFIGEKLDWPQMERPDNLLQRRPSKTNSATLSPKLLHQYNYMTDISNMWLTFWSNKDKNTLSFRIMPLTCITLQGVLCKCLYEFIISQFKQQLAVYHIRFNKPHKLSISWQENINQLSDISTI